MFVAQETAQGGSGATHEPTPSAFVSCWSRPDEEMATGLEQEKSRIESLVESLSDVDSLTIMSPKSSTSAAATPEHSAIDSFMLVNKVFNDDEMPRSSESIDSGVISRQLKPIRTRSCMGSMTPASSSPEIPALTDGSLRRPSSLPLQKQSSTRPGRHSFMRPADRSSSQHSSPEAVQVQPHIDASHRASKPPRFGERLQDPGRATTRATGHHQPSPSRSYRRGQNSFVSEHEGFYSIPNSPETKPESSAGSARGFGTPRHDFSPSGWSAPDHDLQQEPTIQEQTEVLYACIQAMEAELQAHDLQSTPRQGECTPPASSRGALAHPLSTSETIAKAKSAGHSVVVTGGQTHALASSGQAWPVQSYNPQQHNPYQVPMQRWGMNGGANHARARSSAPPQSSKRRGGTPSSSNTHTCSKRSSQSSKRHAKSKASSVSAKGEGVVRSGSDELFAGGAKPKADSKQKKGATAELQKGQTTAISRVLNEEEEEEVVSAGGCLGQFWGANRKVKKKREMPRAPRIAAPVVQQGSEGLGVKLGCW